MGRRTDGRTDNCQKGDKASRPRAREGLEFEGILGCRSRLRVVESAPGWIKAFAENDDHLKREICPGANYGAAGTSCLRSLQEDLPGGPCSHAGDLKSRQQFINFGAEPAHVSRLEDCGSSQKAVKQPEEVRLRSAHHASFVCDWINCSTMFANEAVLPARLPTRGTRFESTCHARTRSERGNLR